MAFPVPSAPKRRPSGPVAALPTVEEVSAGGIVVDFDSPDLPVAIIARINRGGRLEWCLPKGHPENEETDRRVWFQDTYGRLFVYAQSLT